MPKEPVAAKPAIVINATAIIPRQAGLLHDARELLKRWARDGTTGDETLDRETDYFLYTSGNTDDWRTEDDG